jgi:ComF family protein
MRPFSSGLEENRFCGACLRKRPFYEALGAPYVYEGALMESIHRFKYEERTHLANSLGTLLASFTRGWCQEANVFLVMPVPLHPKRLRERGFNQSLLLARHVASCMNADLDFLSLRRIRDTLPQTGLDRDKRPKNVRRAFEIKDPETVKERSVILVDDVATTGSTLNECARVLKTAGCVQVLCTVLARTK